MKRIVSASLVVMFIAFCMTSVGCRAKKEEPPVDVLSEADQAGDMSMTEEGAPEAVTNESGPVTVVETIPPTATPPAAETARGPGRAALAQEKKIQMALENAGFYTGAIDGKLGPKTKKAIEEFQKSKGLKVDGKVGPKTWAELEKHLTR